MSRDLKTFKKSNRDPAEVFRRLKRDAENNICVECNAFNTQWASVTYGIYICMNCSGKHRGLGTHLSAVRSLDMDSWTDTQLAMMEAGGNRNFKMFLRSRGIPEGIDLQTKYSSPALREYRERLKAQVQGVEWREPPPSKFQATTQLTSANTLQSYPRQKNTHAEDDWNVDWRRETKSSEVTHNGRNLTSTLSTNRTLTASTPTYYGGTETPIVTSHSQSSRELLSDSHEYQHSSPRRLSSALYANRSSISSDDMFGNTNPSNSRQYDDDKYSKNVTDAKAKGSDFWDRLTQSVDRFTQQAKQKISEIHIKESIEGLKKTVQNLSEKGTSLVQSILLSSESNTTTQHTNEKQSHYGSLDKEKEDDVWDTWDSKGPKGKEKEKIEDDINEFYRDVDTQPNLNMAQQRQQTPRNNNNNKSKIIDPQKKDDDFVGFEIGNESVGETKKELNKDEEEFWERFNESIVLKESENRDKSRVSDTSRHSPSPSANPMAPVSLSDSPSHAERSGWEQPLNFDDFETSKESSTNANKPGQNENSSNRNQIASGTAPTTNPSIDIWDFTANSSPVEQPKHSLQESTTTNPQKKGDKDGWDTLDGWAEWDNAVNIKRHGKDD
jgi:hypothetical protein